MDWRLLLATLYLAVIHLASSRSLEDTGIFLPHGLDKLAHFCEFGLLAILFWRPLRDIMPKWPEMKSAAVLFVFIVVNGAIDEYHQSLIPNRDSSWGDWFADILGGTLAIMWLLHREKARPATAGSSSV